jgi:hypothetical protein
MQGDQRGDHQEAQGTPGDKGSHIARSRGDTEGRRRVTDDEATNRIMEQGEGYAK